MIGPLLLASTAMPTRTLAFSASPVTSRRALLTSAAAVCGGVPTTALASVGDVRECGDDIACIDARRAAVKENLASQFSGIKDVNPGSVVFLGLVLARGYQRANDPNAVTLGSSFQAKRDEALKKKAEREANAKSDAATNESGGQA